LRFVGDYDDTLKFAKYIANHRLLLDVLFGLLAVVMWESVACGHLPYAPVRPWSRIDVHIDLRTRALHYRLPVLVGTLPIGIPMEKTPGTDPRFFSLLSEFTPVQKTFAT
jgi:hypothetical protein